MCYRLLLGFAITMSTVWTGADMKVMNRTFSYCGRPLHIPLTHTFNSFSIGKNQLAWTNASSIEAKKPFSKVDDATLAMDACEDVKQVSYSIKDGVIDEDIIFRHCQPCDESVWDRHKAVIVAVPLVLVLGAGFGAWFLVTKKGCVRCRDGGDTVT